MSRIAYLVGESGAGKSRLASNLGKHCSIGMIAGDCVLSKTARRLCPELQRGKEMDTGLWLKLAKHPDLQASFRKGISECFVSISDARCPVLAEATLFCIRDLWKAFHGAVHDLMPEIVETRIFYLNVSPEELVRNIAGRKRVEEKIDVKEAEKRIKFFETELRHHEPADNQVWLRNSEEVDRAIRRYLGFPDSVST